MGMNCVDVCVCEYCIENAVSKQSDLKRFTQIKINRITQLFQIQLKTNKKISNNNQTEGKLILVDTMFDEKSKGDNEY